MYSRSSFSLAYQDSEGHRPICTKSDDVQSACCDLAWANEPRRETLRYFERKGSGLTRPATHTWPLVRIARAVTLVQPGSVSQNEMARCEAFKAALSTKLSTKSLRQCGALLSISYRWGCSSVLLRSTIANDCRDDCTFWWTAN